MPPAPVFEKHASNDSDEAALLEALLAGPGIIHELDGSAGQMDGTVDGNMDDEPILPDIPVADSALAHPAIPSLGLW